jgi:hypothetical protein
MEVVSDGYFIVSYILLARASLNLISDLESYRDFVNYIIVYITLSSID